MTLTEEVLEFAASLGAVSAGIATVETLAGGPPSVNLDYVLPGARSALSFALPMNREHIRAFLCKRDRIAHEKDNVEVNMMATGLAFEIAKMLKRKGYESKGTLANLVYRKEIPDWPITLPPDISHRYLAVRSGVGSFGWSGNVGVKGYGAAVILGTCLTRAELQPTDPVPAADGFCDRCKLCVTACPVARIEKRAEKSVTLGGVTFTLGGQKSNRRCELSCGGFTGLHPSGKWSTWSPGRFALPEDEQGFEELFDRSMKLSHLRPPLPGGFDIAGRNSDSIKLTCGNCQIVCFGDREQTAENLELLHGSGCVLQRPDGSLYALPADEAARTFERLDEDFRRLYS